MTGGVRVERNGAVTTVIMDRPQARNAVNGPAAAELHAALEAFDADESAAVAVLWGDNGTFCAGADLKAMGTPDSNPVHRSGPGPMGPTRMVLSKPVIAAVSGYAVAGGLELALWCDMRVVEDSAIFGVFCRRWGVPLIDGGTVRLPRLIGQSRALDMILTGRPVAAMEAFAMRGRADGNAYLSFRDFCRGSDIEEADWQFHLSTLFPEVRAKEHFELRSADAIGIDELAAPIVFVTSLVYDAESADAAASMLPPPTLVLLERAGREGVDDAEIRELCARLAILSVEGAHRLGQQYVTDEHLERVITGGGLAVGKSVLMPPSPDLRGRPELALLRAYVRSLAQKK